MASLLDDEVSWLNLIFVTRSFTLVYFATSFAPLGRWKCSLDTWDSLLCAGLAGSLHYMPQEAEEMANRPGKYEQMPNHVGIRHRLPKIKNAAKGIESSANGQPHRAQCLQLAYKRYYRRYRHPAHDYIGAGRKVAKFARGPDFANNADKRPPPLNTENRPCQPGRLVAQRN